MPGPDSIITPNNFFISTYFLVAVNQIKYGAFLEVTLPNLSVKTEDVVEGGQNTYVHKLPVNVDVGTVTLKRGLTRGSMMLEWYMQIVKGQISDAKQQVAIIMMDSIGVPVVTYNFRDAYPTKWRGPSFKSDSSAIAIEEIELVHHGFEVV